MKKVLMVCLISMIFSSFAAMAEDRDGLIKEISKVRNNNASPSLLQEKVREYFEMDMITDIMVVVGEGTATVVWQTAVPAISKVEYYYVSGTNVLEEATNWTTQEVTVHTIELDNLEIDRDYFYTCHSATSYRPAPDEYVSAEDTFSTAVDLTPRVSYVTANKDNGTYGIGETIPIDIRFTSDVDVSGGSPRLTLVTTSPATTNITMTGGTGTNTLTFDYVVAAGNSSADLTYAATTSLSLNGSTIASTGTATPADLELPVIGEAGSLSALKNIVIDGAAPTVVSVTSDSANGSYKIGDTIPIKVIMSESVTVAGTPTLTIATGGLGTVLSLTSSAANVMTFNYTVASGDASNDLNYATTASLEFAGSTIKDLAGNDANLTLPATGGAGSLATNKTLVVDGNLPTVSSVTSSSSNGSYKAGQTVSVQVVFSESIVVTGTPKLSLATGGAGTSVNFTSSSTNTMTFNYTVQSGDNAADLDYSGTGSLILNGGTIKDAAGNAATLTLPTPGAANSLGANKNIAVDGVIPTVTNVTSPEVNGYFGIGQTITVQVVFSEAVIVSGTPKLNLATGGAGTSVSYSGVGSGTTTLEFDYIVASGNTAADLDYSSTGALTLNSGTINDAAGNPATLTLASPGASYSLANNKNLIVDGTAPTVTNVTTLKANGSYGIGESIDIQVVFSESVNVTPTPTLTLETGTVDTPVNFASGSGSNTLVFTYVVQSGNNTADLDYVLASPLALAGGAIKDVALNNAVLTLPNPGNAGSLGANKAIAIDGVAPQINNTVTSNVQQFTIVVTFLDTAVSDRSNLFISGTKITTGASSMGVWGSISNPAGYLQDIVVDAVNGQVALTLADSEASNSADVITVPFSQVVDAVGNATVNSATPANTVLTITRSTGGPTTRRWGATWGP